MKNPGVIRMKKKILVSMLAILNSSFIIVCLYLNSLQPDHRNLFQSNIDSFFNMAFVFYITFTIMLIFCYCIDHDIKKAEDRENL